MLALLRTRTGHDFSLYKKSTVHRRIERRMGLQQVAGIPQVFESLKTKLSAQMSPLAERGRVYRVWIVGCSTGEEAYSVAMLLREVLEQEGLLDSLRVQIYATDRACGT